jgi:hypothetical protein
MKTPYWYKGMVFAPVLIGLLFVLKITCPAPTGAGCFADSFLTPIFFPLPTIYKIFHNWSVLTMHEPATLLLYWAIVGGLVGLCIDVYKEASN